MLGSWAGLPHGIAAWTPEELAANEKGTRCLHVTRQLAAEVDEIGWHPLCQTEFALDYVWPLNCRSRSGSNPWRMAMVAMDIAPWRTRIWSAWASRRRSRTARLGGTA